VCGLPTSQSGLLKSRGCLGTVAIVVNYRRRRLDSDIQPSRSRCWSPGAS